MDVSQEHRRAALLERVRLERFEIRQVHREVDSQCAAAIETDVASAVRAFLESPGAAPWTFAPLPIEG